MGGLFGGGGGAISTTEPRIGALRVQQSTKGAVIPIVYGTQRIAGNLTWYGDFQAIAHTQTQSSGGKGGGGVTSSSTTYTYQTAVAIGLCAGPISGLGTIWAGKEQTSASIQGFTLFTGVTPQSPWGYLSTYHPGQDLGYSGLAYVAAGALQLGNGASLPNFTFEVQGKLIYPGQQDANPKDVLGDFLTNSVYGVGFPAQYLGDWTSYSNWCVSMGLFLSPSFDQQKAAQQYLSDLAEMTHSAFVWSGNTLKLIPYGDATVSGNGATFTPSITPIYDLTDDDFLYAEGSDPVVVTRKAVSDAFNDVKVEFVNRANQYNVEVAEANDQAQIDIYGFRPDNVRQFHPITQQSVAQTIAQLILQRSVYIRNQYEFKLGWRYCLLEPMDIVTLTDSRLGLNKFQVRVVSVEEDEEGALDVIAEDFPFGVATPSLYSSQQSGGYNVNYNISPGNINAPVIFEPPDQLTVLGLEIWVAASGGANWGGCQVWASTDNQTYQQIGTIHGPARHGVLSAILGSGSDPDTANTLSVDLSVSGGQLVSGTQADADNYRTLCYVDGELVAYETATLTGTNRYGLTYLRRGAYGTSIGSHNAGTQFARLDQAIFKYQFSTSLIGKTIYLKFPSFNQYVGGQQLLSDVPHFTYQVTGSALASLLPNVQNVTTNFVGGLTQIYWDDVSDFRPVDYEIRSGNAWASAKMLGRTAVTHITAQGDGTYWVAAHYRSDSGIDVYSAVPSEIVISGSALVANVVATHDEMGTGWTGTLSGGAWMNNGALLLMGSGNVLGNANVLVEPDIIHLGGVASSGAYEIPVSHEVNIGRVAPCVVQVNYTAYGQSIYDNVLTLQDVLSVTDFLNAALGQKIGIQPQIAVAQSDGIFGAWQNYRLGTYSGQYFKMRVLLSSADPQVTALVTALTFAVDVPDRTEHGTGVSVPAAGLSVTYSAPFNGGPGSATVPNVQITVLSAQTGDQIVLTNSTLNGFTVQITNGGTGVVRNINWLAEGY